MCQRPPPTVIVAQPKQQPVTTFHFYTGTTEASESVEIRARVQGYLDKINFTDGADVSKGDVLFVIDQRPYVAQLDQAKADLEGKKAAAVEQESVYKRDLALLPMKAVTQEDVDIQRGNYLTAAAAVQQAEAAVRSAQLNLDYTTIQAPISGRIGRRLVDVGNLVTANTTLLTTIRHYDPMYVYFTASEANYLAYLKRMRKGELEPSPSSNDLPQRTSEKSPSQIPTDTTGTTGSTLSPVLSADVASTKATRQHLPTAPARKFQLTWNSVTKRTIRTVGQSTLAITPSIPAPAQF